MTKEEVRIIIKTGDKEKISEAVKNYFKENKKADAFEIARKIFNGTEIRKPQQQTIL